MSYMDHSEFAPAAGIQELSYAELQQVGGGPGPMPLIAMGAACAKNKTCRNTVKGAVVAAAGAVAALFGYENNRV